MSNRHPDIVLMHVWIHSDFETGEPDCIDVFDVSGTMSMQWFSEAIQEENGPDLARQFSEVLGGTEDSAWFAVRMSIEDALDYPEFYAEVLSVVCK